LPTPFTGKSSLASSTAPFTIVLTKTWSIPPGTSSQTAIWTWTNSSAPLLNFIAETPNPWLDRFQYKEAGHQLLLMAFLQRVVNGGGRIDRQMAVGNGRTDLTVQWKKDLFVFEMKVRWHSYTETDGLQQLSRYLDKLGQKSGYLAIFEPKSSEELPWEQRLRWETQTYEGKEITLICM
jgi:hypothetical protein